MVTKLNKLRLRWKIFAFLLFFCALLLIILWGFQTVFLSGMYKSIRKRELERVIRAVETEIDHTDLTTIALRLQQENDVMMTLTRDFVQPRPPAPDRMDGRSNMPFEAITETKEFTLQSGQRISLTFYAIIAPVSATISTLRMQLYIITVVMLTISVLLAIVIANRISGPLEEIDRSARELAKGNYATRFSGRGFHEITTLSDTLNTAAYELGKVEGLRRELLANVSHDLRTPLSLIYSYAEMMHDFPNEITPEHSQTIMDETNRLATLVSDVMDISKLENEMEKLNCSRYNLTQSISETTARMNELMRNERYEISFTGGADAYVYADKTKIDRAFYNLLINAVNYSGASKAITVEQTLSGDRVRISVTDGGEGVAPEDLGHIWDRYYKNTKNHKRAVTGTGLGLSIVKKIIELHGGKYGVISAQGEGSTFWFEILYGCS